MRPHDGMPVLLRCDGRPLRRDRTRYARAEMTRSASSMSMVVRMADRLALAALG
jgi:hypothetical protein